MAPLTSSSNDENHQALLDKLDIYAIPKPFRNPNWRPPQRRNKNLRQILSEAQRKEASMMPSQAVSGASTPLPAASDATTGGAQTPVSNGGAAHGGSGGANIAQAAQRLDRLVLERNQAALARQADAGSNAGGTIVGGGGGTGMTVTYTNIESAPSLHPSSQKKYCDVTGLPTSYTDPKSRLRFANAEIYNYILAMPQGQREGYLATRGAHTVLK